MQEWFVRYGSEKELHGPYVDKSKAIEAVEFEMTSHDARYATLYTLKRECSMRVTRQVEMLEEATTA